MNESAGRGEKECCAAEDEEEAGGRMIFDTEIRYRYNIGIISDRLADTDILIDTF
jgi:hypothetical protein